MTLLHPGMLLRKNVQIPRGRFPGISAPGKRALLSRAAVDHSTLMSVSRRLGTAAAASRRQREAGAVSARR